MNNDLFDIKLPPLADLLPPLPPKLPKDLMEPITQVIPRFVEAFRREIEPDFLGSGEFSDAYLKQDIVVKRNRDTSKYNPHLTVGKQKQFLEHSKQEMQSEIKTYKFLKKKTKTPIIPTFMTDYTDKDGRYYIFREYGLSPENISQQSFDKFTKELFSIIRHTEGFFDDQLQPSIRKDNTIFLHDLGRFKTLTGENRAAREMGTPLTLNDMYKATLTKIEHLSEDLNIKPSAPKFVFESLRTEIDQTYPYREVSGKEREFRQYMHNLSMEHYNALKDKFKVIKNE